jgi:hypothetical protein
MNNSFAHFSVAQKRKVLTCLEWIKLKRTWMLLISLALVFLALIGLMITHFLLVATGEILKNHTAATNRNLILLLSFLINLQQIILLKNTKNILVQPFLGKMVNLYLPFLLFPAV